MKMCELLRITLVFVFAFLLTVCVGFGDDALAESLGDGPPRIEDPADQRKDAKASLLPGKSL